LWRRLSVFAGSFRLEAAEAVCSGAGLDRDGVVDAVGSLIEKSILTLGHGSRGGRYRLLETMRLYGAERLREAGEELELRRRHAAWYAQLISGRDLPWWGTSEQFAVVSMLDAEWANVEAALEFCAASGPDAPVGLQMAADLWLYWTLRGRYQIGRRHLETFLALVADPGTTRAMALWAFGFLAQAIGDHEVALAGFEQARLASLQTGGDRELGYSLFGLGLVRLRLGETEVAGELLAASLQVMERADDLMGRSFALYFLATAHAAAGELTDARRAAHEGLDVSAQVGELFVLGVMSTLLGIVEWLLGDVQAAESTLKQAVRSHDETGHRWGTVTSLEGLAWVAASSGRMERASLLLGASAVVWQEQGIALVPYWRQHHDGCEAAALASLGDARYRACWEAGYALTRSEAAVAALEDEASAERDALDSPAGDDGLELTARELEVARLVADGLSNPAIASALFVSVATVKTHVSHILGKLALESRVQLAGWLAAHDPGPRLRDVDR
jgi:DNA-binding CsgD family transcriptional regulator